MTRGNFPRKHPDPVPGWHVASGRAAPMLVHPLGDDGKYPVQDGCSTKIAHTKPSALRCKIAEKGYMLADPAKAKMLQERLESRMAAAEVESRVKVTPPEVLVAKMADMIKGMGIVVGSWWLHDGLPMVVHKITIRKSGLLANVYVLYMGDVEVVRHTFSSWMRRMGSGSIGTLPKDKWPSLLSGHKAGQQSTKMIKKSYDIAKREAWAHYVKEMQAWHWGWRKAKPRMPKEEDFKP